MSQGKRYQNYTFASSELPQIESIENSEKKILRLGKIHLEGYPLDLTENMTPCIMRQNGRYRMWWTRSTTTPSLWHAESYDLKNWFHVKMIKSFVSINTKWATKQFAYNSVVCVDGTYYLYFESLTNSNNGEMGPYVNNIFLATSPDGLNFTMYPSDEDPIPVIKCPPGTQGLNYGIYGIGQPHVFYKDNTFYLNYTNATSGSFNRSCIAQSHDGIHFEPIPDYEYIISAAHYMVTYHSLYQKYMALLPLNAFNQPLNIALPDSYLYYAESDELTNWDCDSYWDAEKKLLPLMHNDYFPHWALYVGNEHMQIDTETMYFFYIINLFEAGKSNNDEITEIHIGAFTSQDSLILPNGHEANDKTLEPYKDVIATWHCPIAEVTRDTPKIDGKQEELWLKSHPLYVETVAINEQYFTNSDSRGKIRFLWDDNNLYLFAEIRNPNFPLQTQAYTDSDTVTLYIESEKQKYAHRKTPINQKTSVVGLFANGKVSGARGAKISTIFTEDGYHIEAAIPLKSIGLDSIEPGDEVWFDVSIKDSWTNTHTQTPSTAIVSWSDYTGLQNQYLDRYGVLRFIE